jgi:hypothetical protein
MCLLGSYQREFFGGVTEDAILLGFRGFGQSGALIAREYLEPVSESANCFSVAGQRLFITVQMWEFTAAFLLAASKVKAV